MPTQGNEALRAKRDSFVSNDRADQAARVLDPYITKRATDLESALRNFLVDFLHLATRKSDQRFTTEKLREIIDQAAELHSAEPSAKPPGGGAGSIPLS